MTNQQSKTNTPKTVLITGATRGIGLALAQLYKTSGWNVIGAARNLDTAEKLKALEPYKLVQIDTSDEASILEAAQELEGEAIDLLINNAGIMGTSDAALAETKASIMEQFEVNSVGPFLVTRALLPNLRAAVAKNGSAVVGQISSIMGSVAVNLEGGPAGNGGLYGYRTSKTALNMINANLALDLKKDRITSIALHPGYVSTDMTAHGGEINTDESVIGISKVLASVTEEDSGKFFQFDGVNLPW